MCFPENFIRREAMIKERISKAVENFLREYRTGEGWKRGEDKLGKYVLILAADWEENKPERWEKFYYENFASRLEEITRQWNQRIIIIERQLKAESLPFKSFIELLGEMIAYELAVDDAVLFLSPEADYTSVGSNPAWGLEETVVDFDLNHFFVGPYGKQLIKAIKRALAKIEKEFGEEKFWERFPVD
jgi:hypothetical protein